MKILCKFSDMENTHKTSRTLVNIIGIPSLLFIIYFGDLLFLLLIAGVMFIGSAEFISLSKLKGADPFAPTLNQGVLGIGLLYYFDKMNHILPFMMLIIVGVMIVEVFRKNKSPFLNISSTVFAMIWLGVLIGSMIYIRNNEAGFIITLSMFLSVWTCDTFGFFFGKNFGDKKILPEVSPKKTWIGSIAGLVGSLLCMNLFYYGGFFTNILNLCDVLILGVICGLFGQLGDFAESLLKRDVSVKDSGTFLRGHGGVLDRFDSLTFASPLVLLYLKYFTEIFK